MANFFNYFKKPIFGQFYPFWGQKKFPLPRTNKYGILTLYQNLEKTNDPIPRKMFRKLDEQTDGQTLFHRTLRATTRSPAKSVKPKLFKTLIIDKFRFLASCLPDLLIRGSSL